MHKAAAQLAASQWRAAFDPGALTRGERYAAQDRVSQLSIESNLITAVCRGSAGQHYSQRIQLGSSGMSVMGRCNCPVGYNCKHCVAVIVQVLQQADADKSEYRATTSSSEQCIDDLQPLPCIILVSHIPSQWSPRRSRLPGEPQHRLGLQFIYQGQRVHGKAKSGERLRYWPEQQAISPSISIARQAETEDELRQRLLNLGFSSSLRQSAALPANTAELFELGSDSQWLRFIKNHLPLLRAEGWQVEILPGFHFDLTPVDSWYAEVDEDPGNAWFDLELGILVEGQRISLLPVLMRLIQRNPELLSSQRLNQHADDELLQLPLDVPGASGRPLQVLLPFARLKPLLATLGELYLNDAGAAKKLRLNRLDAARLSDLQAEDMHWQGGESVRRFSERLKQHSSHEQQAPEGLQASLRPYQLEGLAWLQNLRELEVGGILGDDMGLGKTLQTLAHILTEKQAGRLDRPALAVMPTSLIPNWQDEALRFTPQLRVLTLHGTDRHALFSEMAGYDLILTTYALLPRDLEHLQAQPLHLLVLDEAQNIKNPKSKAAQAAGQLQARQRLCLSGTPLENHLGELWSLFNFLLPGWLGDSKSFNRDYRSPIEKHGDGTRLAHLNGRIKPFLLRRSKEAVATELPAKTEIIHWVDLNERQRDLYETVRLAMNDKVRAEIKLKGMARSQIVILDALLKLRQVCCDLRLVKTDNPSAKPVRGSHSGKLDSLLEMLEELFAEGRKVLLFSQFTSMLTLIEAELTQRGIDYALLTGSTRDRREPVRRFQAGEVPLFLISLKAGGTGLNLTAADTVIHFDPWWNPAVEQQATDRAYRIGQDKPVFVYRLIARGTVEEKIQLMQQRKAELAASILEGRSDGDWQLQEDDLSALFAPLPKAKH